MMSSKVKDVINDNMLLMQSLKAPPKDTSNDVKGKQHTKNMDHRLEVKQIRRARLSYEASQLL